MEREWEEALALGKQLAKSNPVARYQAAVAVQAKHGLCAKHSEMISDSDQELLNRLRLIFAEQVPIKEQSAVLGLVEQPELSMEQAFDRFWDHIADEWRGLSHYQQRVKRNT